MRCAQLLVIGLQSFGVLVAGCDAFAEETPGSEVQKDVTPIAIQGVILGREALAVDFKRWKETLTGYDLRRARISFRGELVSQNLDRRFIQGPNVDWFGSMVRSNAVTIGELESSGDRVIKGFDAVRNRESLARSIHEFYLHAYWRGRRVRPLLPLFLIPFGGRDTSMHQQSYESHHIEDMRHFFRHPNATRGTLNHVGFARLLRYRRAPNATEHQPWPETVRSWLSGRALPTEAAAVNSLATLDYLRIATLIGIRKSSHQPDAECLGFRAMLSMATDMLILGEFSYQLIDKLEMYLAPLGIHSTRDVYQARYHISRVSVDIFYQARVQSDRPIAGWRWDPNKVDPCVCTLPPEYNPDYQLSGVEPETD